MDARGYQEGQPEAHVACSVGHSYLSNYGAKVDKEIKPIVDPGNRRSWINNDALTGLGGLNFQLVPLDLLGDQR